MKIKVGNNIEVTEMNSIQSQKLIHYLKSKLEIDNPDFYKLQKSGKWTGGTERRLILYQKVKNGFLIPFGSLQDIYYLFKGEANFELEFKKVENVNFNSKIKPYDYQEQAIEMAIRKKNGVIIAPCGAGKTEMALEIIARVKKPALWITHTKELLNQSKERALSLFDIPKECFGEITNGKVNIGTHITFATVQTLSKINLEDIKNAFGIIVVDECHRVGGTPTNLMMFYKCLSQLACRYKIGVTATPKKTNGLEATMYSLLGNKIIEIPKEVVDEKLCPVEVYKVNTNYELNINDITKTDGTIDYTKFINSLCKDDFRNDVINLIIREILRENKNCIVLSERVKHLEILNSSRNDSLILTSKSKNRNEILESFKSGKTKVLFSTYQMLAEGFDYKDLNCLVLATPQKNERIVTQACGRVARKSDKKQKGEIYDLVDDFGMCYGMWKKRKSIYKKNGYEIID